MIESDLQHVINSILSRIKVSSQIINHVNNILNLTNTIKNIQFMYL